MWPPLDQDADGQPSSAPPATCVPSCVTAYVIALSMVWPRICVEPEPGAKKSSQPKPKFWYIESDPLETNAWPPNHEAPDCTTTLPSWRGKSWGAFHGMCVCCSAPPLNETKGENEYA